MAEEQNTTSTNPMEQDYLEQIQQLKDNTVSKTDYQRMAEENRKLLNQIVNGSAQAEPAMEPAPDLGELRNSLFNRENTNLAFVSKALTLRKALMDAGEEDPFVPQGHQIHSTTEDYAAAERVAEVLQECVDAANGSSEVFTAELQRRTRDAAPFHR